MKLSNPIPVFEWNNGLFHTACLKTVLLRANFCSQVALFLHHPSRRMQKLWLWKIASWSCVQYEQARSLDMWQFWLLTTRFGNGKICGNGRKSIMSPNYSYTSCMQKLTGLRLKQSNSKLFFHWSDFAISSSTTTYCGPGCSAQWWYTYILLFGRENLHCNRMFSSFFLLLSSSYIIQPLDAAAQCAVGEIDWQENEVAKINAMNKFRVKKPPAPHATIFLLSLSWWQLEEEAVTQLRELL